MQCVIREREGGGEGCKREEGGERCAMREREERGMRGWWGCEREGVVNSIVGRVR